MLRSVSAMKQFMLPKLDINGDVFEVRRLIFEMIDVDTHGAMIYWLCAAKTVSAYHLGCDMTGGLFKRPAMSAQTPIEFLIMLTAPKCKLAIVPHIIRQIGLARIKCSKMTQSTFHLSPRKLFRRERLKTPDYAEIFDAVHDRYDRALATIIMMHSDADRTKGPGKLYYAHEYLFCVAIKRDMARTIEAIHHCAQFSSDLIGKVLKELSIDKPEPTKRAIRNCYHPNGTSVLVRY